MKIKIKLFFILKHLELVLNDNLKEAFIIGVDEKAKERLRRLTESKKVTPIDIENILSTSSSSPSSSSFSVSSSSSSESASNSFSSYTQAEAATRVNHSLNTDKINSDTSVQLLNTEKSSYQRLSLNDSNTSSSFSSFKSYKSSLDHRSELPPLPPQSQQPKMVKHQQQNQTQTFHSLNPFHERFDADNSMPEKALNTTFNSSTNNINININTSTNGLIQIKNQINSGTSSNSSFSSLKKQRAPLAPNSPLIKETNVAATVHHKPFVLIKDNQLKSINLIHHNHHVNTITNTTMTPTTSMGNHSTKSNKSVLSSASNSTTNCDDIQLSSSSSSSSTTPSTSSKSSNQQQQQQSASILSSPVQSNQMDNPSISPNYCSTSSVSSNSLPSPQPLSQHTNVMDPNNIGVIDIPIDSSHREMAIDCPDNFVPEIKTRPCYPPQQIDTTILHQEAKSVSSSSSSSSKKKSSSNKKNKKIKKKTATNTLTPSITASSSTSVTPSTNTTLNVSNTSELHLIAPTTTKNFSKNNKNESASHQNMSASLSSIQYIDDEVRTKAVANVVIGHATTSPLSLLNAEINGLDCTSKISIGKKLFEKQKQHTVTNGGNTSPFLRNNSLRHGQATSAQFKYGAVNSGFQIDDEETFQSPLNIDNNSKADDLVELDNNTDDELTKVKNVRPPTPPVRADTLLLSSVNAIDIDIADNQNSPSSTTSLDAFFKSIQTKAFNIDELKSSSSSEYIEIQDLFKNIDFIQNKLDEIKNSNSLSNSCVSYESLKQSQAIDFSLSNLMDNDLAEKLFKACNQDVNLLRKMCETKNFRNTLDLYNRLIKLNANVPLKPLASNAQELADEVFIYLHS
jgi:hypothetical protein